MTDPPAGTTWPGWVPDELAGAVDLGHVPQQTAVTPASPVTFVDEAQSRGLGDARGGGNTHGVGLALVDLDGDGWLDLVVANGLSNANGTVTESALYWNQGDGTFVDGTEEALGDALVRHDLFSVAAGDLDNDGDVDLYFGSQPHDLLLANNGDRTFLDVTAFAGAEGPTSDPQLTSDGRGKIVSIGDYDNDGWQDLVSATSTRPPPGAALLRNRGGGFFDDETASSRITIASEGHPCAVMFTDLDNDGWRDLWIWNDRGGHVLLQNDGGSFVDLQNEADRVSIRNPMGIDAADFDRDGDLDYYVSNISSHPFLVNQGDGTFEDRSAELGTLGEYGWGLAFEDFDLDGWADLYVTQEDDRPVLAYRNLSGSIYQSFPHAVPPPLLVGAAHNTPAAFGDVDNDGRVDVVFVRTDQSPLVLHHNVTDVGGRHWLTVEVEETPETGERGGIGARVVVRTPDGGLQFRDVTGGSSRGSQNALSVRFGLDAWDGAESVFVMWPDGRTRSYVNVPGDGVLVVR